MDIVKGQWFRLPRLGPDVFRSLMQARLKYDRTKGFIVDDRTDVNRVTSILSSALGKPVTIRIPVETPECYVCSLAVECDTCAYNAISSRIGFCLCNAHYQGLDTYQKYRAVFSEELREKMGFRTSQQLPSAAENRAWSEKYRPFDLAMMVGNEKQRFAFLSWLANWKPGTKPTLLLGPPGVGKSTIVQLAADKLGMALVQLNASDNRSKSQLERIIRPGGPSVGLLGDWEKPSASPRLLIFLDEIDGLEGRADYGAVEYIKQVILQSPYPVVMAANDEDSEILTKLAGWGLNAATTIRLPRTLPRMVALYVRFVADQEDVKLDQDTLTRIVANSNGDIRAALNNFQQVAQADTQDVPRLLPNRDEQANRAEVFSRIYGARTFKEAYEALELLELSRPREMLRLAFANIIGNNLSGKDLAKAMDRLSQLDRLATLMESQQQWHLLRYFRRILAGILFSFKKQVWRYIEEDQDFQTIRFRVWNDGRIIREITRKVGEHAHTSSRTTAFTIYPYLIILYSNDPSSEPLKALIAYDESSQRVTEKEAERINMAMPA